MIIKKFEPRGDELRILEELLEQADSQRRRSIEKEIRNVRAGTAAEKESAYHIDFGLESSKNWVVIHDLRVEASGRVAQIDHLLINRLMEVFVLESKSVHSGIKITEEGEFLRWNDWMKTYEGMASPLSQNERHIAVLADALKSIELPSRLGMRLEPTFESYVLISPKARIDRPKKFDTSRIVKSDDFVKTMFRQGEEISTGKALLTITKIISQESLETLGHQIASLHRPSTIDYRAKFGISNLPAPEAAIASPNRSEPNEAPACRQCKSRNVSILYGKYGYYFKCGDCDGNTPIRVSCGREGHRERIRKEGTRFFRECADCKTSSLFFINAEK